MIALDLGSCVLQNYNVEAGILYANILKDQSSVSWIINYNISLSLNLAYVKLFPVVLLLSQTANYSKLRGMELIACLRNFIKTVRENTN